MDSQLSVKPKLTNITQELGTPYTLLTNYQVTNFPLFVEFVEFVECCEFSEPGKSKCPEHRKCCDLPDSKPSI